MNTRSLALFSITLTLLGLASSGLLIGWMTLVAILFMLRHQIGTRNLFMVEGLLLLELAERAYEIMLSLPADWATLVKGAFFTSGIALLIVNMAGLALTRFLKIVELVTGSFIYWLKNLSDWKGR